jgi:hypothetical protein
MPVKHVKIPLRVQERLFIFKLPVVIRRNGTVADQGSISYAFKGIIFGIGAK